MLMGKNKDRFVYNNHTLRYEKVVQTKWQKAGRVASFLCAAIVTAILFTIVSRQLFPSAEEAALQKQLEEMEQQVVLAQGEVAEVREVLESIQERDAYAYRMIFGMEPVSEAEWESGIGGHEAQTDAEAGSSLDALHKDIDRLKRQLALQSYSLDSIMQTAKEKEAMMAAMPSIKPVNSDQLPRSVRLLSGFGMRIHPIYKVPKMHYGIDFTAPSGTPIQATGAGRVVKAARVSGYGNQVVIDHGYGFKTSYAHMKRIDVKVGDRVERGSKIGLVGSTGASTAPHCHYEVMVNGQKVNPIMYCMDGLTPEQYADLVKAAETSNQSFD